MLLIKKSDNVEKKNVFYRYSSSSVFLHGKFISRLAKVAKLDQFGIISSVEIHKWFWDWAYKFNELWWLEQPTVDPSEPDQLLPWTKNNCSVLWQSHRACSHGAHLCHRARHCWANCCHCWASWRCCRSSCSTPLPQSPALTVSAWRASNKTDWAWLVKTDRCPHAQCRTPGHSSWRIEGPDADQYTTSIGDRQIPERKHPKLCYAARRWPRVCRNCTIQPRASAGLDLPGWRPCADRTNPPWHGWNEANRFPAMEPLEWRVHIWVRYFLTVDCYRLIAIFVKSLICKKNNSSQNSD